MRKLLVWSAVVLCLVTTMDTIAQSTNAALGGTVTDQTGALIPGVSVRATNTDTGVVTVAVTNESGVYSFPSLQPGNSYTVAAELPGFQTKMYRDLELGPARQVRQNFTLQLAGLTASLEVIMAADAALTATGASVGTVLTQNAVRDLPIVGRDAL